MVIVQKDDVFGFKGASDPIVECNPDDGQTAKVSGLNGDEKVIGKRYVGARKAIGFPVTVIGHSVTENVF